MLISRLLRLFALLICLFPAFAYAEGRTIIVLDGSGSMWGQIDGKPKLEIAREALDEVLKNTPADTELGLIAYGHRSKGACDDIETLVAPAKATAATISSAAAKMQFLGKTPLTEAVRRAAAELHSTEEKATVVLITDGIETCQGDPCALAAELESSGVDFTAHVVGFGMTKDEGQQVACLADKTGGKYIAADDLASLKIALQDTVIAPAAPEPAPEPAPPAKLEVNFAPTALLAPGVKKPDDPDNIIWEIYPLNADGTAGERLDTEYDAYKGYLEPGNYRLITKLGDATVTTDISVTADQLAAPEVILNAALVTVHPKGTKDGPIEDNAAVQFTNPSADINTTNYGEKRFYVPAGDYTVTSELGEASVVENLTLTAGQILDKEIVIETGVAAIEGYYVEGMLIEGNSHAVIVAEAKKSIDGTRKELVHVYGTGNLAKLPPGDYVAIVELGGAHGETPFTVKGGERVDVAVILNAGILAVTAPGTASIEVLGKKDINGNAKSYLFEYKEEASVALPPGDYIVETKKGDALQQTPATVKPGERSEIAVP